jgi:rhodanese-related sulfurtransferase
MTQIIQAHAIPSHDIPFIVDVRTPDEYLQEHIPGSQNIPLDELPNAVARLKAQDKVIVSCRSGNRASQACLKLEQLGFPNLQLLEGGLIGWKNARRETVSLKKGFSIMQQVQIIVGVMVLVGTFFQPFWLLAPIAGAGMLIAGLSNTCMMAVLLGKMPWNKTPSDIAQQCGIR